MSKVKSVEDYLIELLNAKYARRIMQKINTEWEKLSMQQGSEPGKTEYEWMVKRALDIHREIVGGVTEVKNEKKAEDSMGAGGSKST